MRRPPSVVSWLVPICASLAFVAPVLAQTRIDGKLPAQQIVIDKDTGRPRMPEHDEFLPEAPSAAARAARSEGAAAGLRSPHPVLQRMQAQPVATRTGAVAQRVDPSVLSYTVVRRRSDGTLGEICVTGEDAARAAVFRAHDEEAGHEH